MHNRCGKCLDPRDPVVPVKEGSKVMVCSGCGSKMDAYRIATASGIQVVYFTQGEHQERIDWHCEIIRKAASDHQEMN